MSNSVLCSSLLKQQSSEFDSKDHTSLRLTPWYWRMRSWTMSRRLSSTTALSRASSMFARSWPHLCTSACTCAEHLRRPHIFIPAHPKYGGKEESQGYPVKLLPISACRRAQTDTAPDFIFGEWGVYGENSAQAHSE